MKESLFIINPSSARGNTLRLWAAARKRLTELEIPFSQHVTTRPGEAASVARASILGGCMRVVAVGGDGTLNEVINGYLNGKGEPLNPEAVVALLPSGTGSDFRRSLNLKNMEDALRSLARPNTRRIDAIRANFINRDGGDETRFCINMASIGLGGDVCAYVNGWRASFPKWVGGRARFSLAALRALEKYRNRDARLRVNGGRELTIKSNLLVVANGRFGGGGMMLAPHARLDDGLLDVIVTDGATRLDIIRELLRIRRGGHLKNKRVSEHRAKSIGIETDEPLAIELDGELVGQTPAELSILHSAVTFASWREGD